LQREIRAILTYSAQQHNDIFQKHFHNTIERNFLDINWLLETFSDIEQGIHTKFLDNEEGTVNKIGKGRTEIVFTYECDNHDANEIFKCFFEDEIEGHAERLEWWLDEWNIYMVDMGYPITEEELSKFADTYTKKAFSYKYEIK